MDGSEVFAHSTARGWGLSDSALRGLVARGELQRARRGVYRWDRPGIDARETHLRDIQAAAQTFTAGYAVSHLSAALLHGFAVPPGPLGNVHLTTIDAAQQSRRRHGVTIHHCDSGPTPVTDVDGHLVTDAARTVADCLRTLPARSSVPIADSALRAGLHIEDVAMELDRQVRWRGRPLARQSLLLVDGRRESWLESRSFVALDEWGQPLPIPQVEVYDGWGAFVARVDGLWVDDNTVCEVDGG